MKDHPKTASEVRRWLEAEIYRENLYLYEGIPGGATPVWPWWFKIFEQKGESFSY